MKRLSLTIALAVVLAPRAAVAQHDGHQAGAPPPSPAQVAQCAQAQPVVENIIAAAMARLEAARLSNNPAEMRAAIDHLEATLRDIRTQLAPCAPVRADAPDPHAGHAMPNTETKPIPPEKPASTLTTEPTGKQMDPVNGLMVDAATAPKTTFQGHTYYFSSEQSRKEFLANPAKFARKPKQ